MALRTSGDVWEDVKDFGEFFGDSMRFNNGFAFSGYLFGIFFALLKDLLGIMLYFLLRVLKQIQVFAWEEIILELL